ncbi:MAG TPA: hypothetical protein VF526_13170 [Solirubrobacteraceae bacterium]|jgi:hypothetical protein
MRFGKRRKDGDSPVDEPVIVAAPEPPPGAMSGSWTAGGWRPAQTPPAVVAPEGIVEGEAVEIPAEPHVYAAVRPAAAFEPPTAFAVPAPQPAAMPFPVAEQPVAVGSPGMQPERGTPLGATAATFASGHGPAPAPAWPEAVQELAAQRPEVVVGAAFVGGILAAMILRRLGN